MRRSFLAALAVFPTLATAQDFETRTSDLPLATGALVERLTSGPVAFYDGAVSLYASDGAFSYTYSEANGGATVPGTWEARGQGVVCTEFPNGFGRCDLFVSSGERLVLITEEGDRFRVRPAG